MFAKLFDSEEHGQILVTRENDDKGVPAIACAIPCEDPLDVARIFISYPDTDEGRDKRDFQFNAIGPAKAENIVEQAIKPALSRMRDSFQCDEDPASKDEALALSK